MLVDCSVEGSVCDVEMRMAGFISEYNLSFSIMNHFSDLLPKLCPDSKIAAHFKFKHTKSKCIVWNAFASHYNLELVQKLQTSHFSVIIDETTDVSTAKELAAVTRVYNSESMNTDCPLYDLLEIAHGDAESVFQALVGFF